MKDYRRSSLIFALILVQLLVVTAATVQAAGLQAAGRQAVQGDEPVLYERYDVYIDVREDGTFHVREEQEILFNESLRTAFAEIPLDYVGEIRNVQVAEDGTAYTQVSGTPANAGTYGVSYEQQAVAVEWMYEETVPGESRTFIVEYDVAGGLWIYEDGDILEWRAVPADRSGVPVLSSTVTVTLPQGAGAETLQANAFGPPFSVEIGERQVVFTTESEIADGVAFQIMVGFDHGLVEGTVQPWQRAEDSAELAYSVRSVETELAIGAGGEVQVTELQTVAVEEGILYGGQRAIPLAYVDGLVDFSVAEGEQPFVLLNQFDPNCESCAWLEENRGPGDWIRLNRGTGTMTLDEEAAGQVQVGWTAPPLVKGEETTFVLRYTAVGALQIGEEAQILAWTAVSGFDVPVAAARILLQLPPDVPAGSVEVQGGAVETLEDGRLLVAHDDPLAAGDSWQVRIALPPNATTGPKPVWQQEMEEVVLAADEIREDIRQEEIRRSRLQLAFGLLGGLLLVGGLLLLGLMWYLWGRDAEAAAVPQYLSDPPSDLPPGIVAYLLDEKPTPKGVLASLFHLATLGLLRIELSDPLKLARNWEDELVEEQMIETSDGDTAPVPVHMVRLFNGLRPHLGSELTPLSQVTSHFPQIIPEVYYAMGQEATGFFAQLPGQARRRWLVYGQWLVLGGVGLALAAALFYVPALGWVAAMPAVALAIVGAALIVVSRWMPRRSAAGVEEAARWRAFEQYLRNLQQYGDQEDAQRILDRHFAYAVALDVEDVVLSQAEQMDTVVPTWTQPVIIYRPSGAPGPSMEPSPLPGPLRRRPATQGKLPGASVQAPQGRESVRRSAPSLAGMADALASQLEGANDSLTRTLSQAVGEVNETPFELVWRGARGAGKLTWSATTTSLEIMETILDEASSGGGSSSYRGSTGSGRSSSRSSWGSSRSSRSSGRSSSSRRSGGGGRRGFGR